MAARGGTRAGAVAIAAVVFAALLAALLPRAPRAAPVEAAATADADVVEAAKLDCIGHHEDAQLTRRRGKLLAARAALLVCSRASCPAAVRADCVDWLEDVNRSVPSIVVTARERGTDTVDVKVLIDGELVAQRLSGSALEADPGEHRFRFESPRWPAVERSVLMSEGIKNRPIDVEFAPASVPVRAAAPSDVRPLTRGDYTFGAVALAGLLASASLGGWALYERGQLRQSCAPFCADATVSSLKTKLVVADVALGVGLASLALGLYRYLTRPLAPSLASLPPSGGVTLSIDAAPGGAAIGVGGVF